jgi:hypothetical protein
MLIRFTAPLWLWKGEAPAAWHLITLPVDESQIIRLSLPKGGGKRGWGSVRVKATIGGSTWQTSLFPASKLDAYLLPVKSEIRKAEGLVVGEAVDVRLSLDL